MNNPVFWDMTKCNLLKINRRFGETCPYFHGLRMSKGKKISMHWLESRVLTDITKQGTSINRNPYWFIARFHPPKTGIFRLFAHFLTSEYLQVNTR
jgi:hypothetical protein